MLTVISRFCIANGLDEPGKAFLVWPRPVETVNGLCGLEVLTVDPSRSMFLLITRWKTEAEFRAWYGTEAYHHALESIPEGVRLDASFTQIIAGNRAGEAKRFSELGEALGGQTRAFCRWLEDTEAVFAVVVGLDGTIRFRNRAAHRTFPGDPDGRTGANILEFVVSSEVQSLKSRFTDPALRDGKTFRLNVKDWNDCPHTMEASIIHSPWGLVMLGAIEQSSARSRQTEIQVMTNKLSMTIRELVNRIQCLRLQNESLGLYPARPDWTASGWGLEGTARDGIRPRNAGVAETTGDSGDRMRTPAAAGLLTGR